MDTARLERRRGEALSRIERHLDGVRAALVSADHWDLHYHAHELSLGAQALELVGFRLTGQS